MSSTACSQQTAALSTLEPYCDAGAAPQLSAAAASTRIYDAGTAIDAATQIAATQLRPELTSEPDDEANYVFDGAQLRTYNLIVAPSDLARIAQSPSSEMYVPASMEFEGTTYSPIRMRYKGRGGAFEPPCTLTGAGVATPKVGKCSIKVDFDVDNDATFYGLKKLNFHAMGQDPSMLRERLGHGLFRDMGIAAPSIPRLDRRRALPVWI